MCSYQRRCAAFTAVELLTAVFITMVMMVMVNQIFKETTDAVTMGVGLSEVMAGARTVGDQLKRDMNPELMRFPWNTSAVTPPAGFLLIVNRQRTGVPVYDAGGGESTRTIRSDQIVFFTSQNDPFKLFPMTPENLSGTTYFNRIDAPTAMVWYGHVWLDDTGGITPGSGKNTYGTNWILGRQSILLAGPAALPSEVTNVIGDPTGAARIAGTSDVSTFALHDLDGALTGYNGSNTLFTDGGTAADKTEYKDNNQHFYFADDLPVDATLQDTDYAARASAYAFSPTQYLPTATPRSVAAADAANGKLTEVAKMHSFLVGNCSDFIVEFAGDYQDPDDVDGDTNLQESDGKLDTYLLTEGGTDVRRVRWYGRYADDAAGTQDATGFGMLNVAGAPIYHAASGSFCFRHYWSGSAWPRMIRIRYRLHDKRGQLTDRNQESGRWFEHVINVRTVPD